MAHPLEAQIQEIVDYLGLVKDLANTNLKTSPSLIPQINAPLTLLQNRLNHLIGGKVNAPETEGRKFGPMKITPVAKPEIKMAPMKSPEEAFAEELKKQVKAIWPGFLKRPTDELMDSLSDPQVRGIAVLAGIKVTETDPERITPKFIDQIKAKMIADAEQRKKINKGIKEADKQADQNPTTGSEV